MKVIDVVQRFATCADIHPDTVRHLGHFCLALTGIGMGDMTIQELAQWENWEKLRDALIAGGWMIPSKNLPSRGWSRSYINSSLSRLKSACRWCAERDIIPLDVCNKICLYYKLRLGRTAAREYIPCKDVEWRDIEAIREYTDKLIWDMVCVQFLTGMRMNEVCRLNVREMDMSRDNVWLFSPVKHKTVHHGKSKVIVLGKSAVEIVRRNMGYGDDGYVFVDDDLKPITPGIYRRRVQYYVDKAMRRKGTKKWTTHTLRHARAKIVDRTMGREAACAVLGNSPDAAAIYASRNLALAIEAAMKAELPKETA